MDHREKRSGHDVRPSINNYMYMQPVVKFDGLARKPISAALSYFKLN